MQFIQGASRNQTYCSTLDDQVSAGNPEKIAEGPAQLKERSIKYGSLQQQLNNTDDKQISTTDPDSRSILIVKNIVEVAYNT